VEFKGSLAYDPIVKGDDQRIMQILMNLQSNALKFTKKGQVKIEVSRDTRGNK
jgi:signal transduction histidine kinase